MTVPEHPDRLQRGLSAAKYACIFLLGLCCLYAGVIILAVALLASSGDFGTAGRPTVSLIGLFFLLAGWLVVHLWKVRLRKATGLPARQVIGRLLVDYPGWWLIAGTLLIAANCWIGLWIGDNLPRTTWLGLVIHIILSAGILGFVHMAGRWAHDYRNR